MVDVANGPRQRNSGRENSAARVVTVAMEGMSFLEPVRWGHRQGVMREWKNRANVHMTIPVEVWVTRHISGEERLRYARRVYPRCG
jgi:acyl-CoA hydrolase